MAHSFAQKVDQEVTITNQPYVCVSAALAKSAQPTIEDSPAFQLDTGQK
jgi:hypothetical protein